MEFQAVKRAADELEPNLLCVYVYDVARDFNFFYEHCRILGSAEQERRLRFCLAAEVVLGKCLDLLNVRTLEQI
jgi:arginyl-tRNA synthetase